MSDYETIIYGVDDSGVATITLNRPERRNALSHDLMHELEDAFNTIETDDNVRIAVIAGAAPAFCAGYDLTPNQARPSYSATERWDSRVPFIAAVDGPAAAAGNVLALSCDLVIASTNAQFGEPEIRHVAHSPHVLLPYLTSNRYLREFYYTGDFIDANQAEKWGLVNKVVDAGTALEEATKMARRIAQNL
jgi:enoyl-CoA hydratase